ncbi:hypothetical protein CLF_107606 [Clonorchis sinensis]|uniref:Uncharacterized protein n=1 Tax=Clonorchis sinensis TaxID=79923 RepID=G7YQU8_CLOSI|nr:hypothetical protein CLF_107606 [Clonorchis sinensis]
MDIAKKPAEVTISGYPTEHRSFRSAASYNTRTDIFTCGVLRITRGAKQSSKMQASLAFNIIGLLSIIAASIFFLILFFACQKLYKLFMVLVIVLTVISLISFSIATGTAYHPNNPSYGAWVLSAVWNSVLAIVISIIFLLAFEFHNSNRFLRHRKFSTLDLTCFYSPPIGDKLGITGDTLTGTVQFGKHDCEERIIGCVPKNQTKSQAYSNVSEDYPRVQLGIASLICGFTFQFLLGTWSTKPISMVTKRKYQSLKTQSNHMSENNKAETLVHINLHTSMSKCE